MVKIPVEDDYSKIYLEDDILHCTIKVRNLDITTAKAMVGLRLTYTKNKTVSIFIDASKVTSVTKEARDYFSSDMATNYVKAAAILAPSVVVRILANFFLGFGRPKVPAKVFTNEKEALSWLKDYKKD